MAQIPRWTLKIAISQAFDLTPNQTFEAFDLTRPVWKAAKQKHGALIAGYKSIITEPPVAGIESPPNGVSARDLSLKHSKWAKPEGLFAQCILADIDGMSQEDFVSHLNITSNYLYQIKRKNIELYTCATIHLLNHALEFAGHVLHNKKWTKTPAPAEYRAILTPKRWQLERTLQRRCGDYNNWKDRVFAEAGRAGAFLGCAYAGMARRASR